MCGRFTLILEPSAIQEELNLGDFDPGIKPRYNVAPTQPVAAVTDPTSRAVHLLRWGLIPSWAKDPAVGNRMINARSETLLEKASFRTAFTRRRCLILADGFYEWYRPGGKRTHSQPFFFHMADGKPFAFAGLWDTWQSPEGDPIRSCTIITCAANGLVGQYHERMPVILDAERIWQWMEPRTRIDALQSMLNPYPAEMMDAYRVSDRVNSPDYEEPGAVQAVQGLL